MKGMKLRFFCDLCGTEVPRNTVRCPTCGRYFTAIQCPRCHFQGEEKDFDRGCPKCGYMKPRAAAGGTATGGAAASVGDAGRKPRRRGKSALRSPKRRSAKEPSEPAVPAAFYRLVGILLALILIGLVIVLLLR
jgi:hypothetical protein